MEQGLPGGAAEVIETRLDRVMRSPATIGSRSAGRSEMRTTEPHLHLDGVVFRHEAERLRQRTGSRFLPKPLPDPPPQRS